MKSHHRLEKRERSRRPERAGCRLGIEAIESWEDREVTKRSARAHCAVNVVSGKAGPDTGKRAFAPTKITPVQDARGRHGDWERMHSVVLRYFEAVAEDGSIRRAAERLHISPSAVNRQILRLEEHFGTLLGCAPETDHF